MTLNGNEPTFRRDLSAGVARYHAQHGLDENGNRPEPELVNPTPLGSPENPIVRTSYRLESGR